MAKYYITYMCGHDGTVQIYGPINLRGATAERKEGEMCPACLQEKWRADRIAENTAAAEESKVAGWPVLAGTEKQIAWAETLRAAAMPRLETMAAHCSAKLTASPDDALTQQISSLISTWIGEKSAKEWIETRVDMANFSAIERRISRCVGLD